MHCLPHIIVTDLGDLVHLGEKNISQLILPFPEFHVYVRKIIYMIELDTGTPRFPSLE